MVHSTLYQKFCLNELFLFLSSTIDYLYQVFLFISFFSLNFLDLFLLLSFFIFYLINVIYLYSYVYSKIDVIQILVFFSIYYQKPYLYCFVFIDTNLFINFVPSFSFNQIRLYFYILRFIFQAFITLIITTFLFLNWPLLMYLMINLHNHLLYFSRWSKCLTFNLCFNLHIYFLPEILFNFFVKQER